MSKQAREAAQKSQAEAGFRIKDEDPAARIFGPSMFSESAFRKVYSDEEVDTLKRKSLTHGFRSNEGYQCNSWNDPASVKARVDERIDDLEAEDPDYVRLLVDADKRILRTGIMQAGGLKRAESGLRSAYDDDLYMETLKYLLLSMVEGVVKAYPTMDDLQNNAVRVVLPSGRGKGFGFREATNGEYPDCCAGGQADEAMYKNIFPQMLDSQDGIFKFEFEKWAIGSGFRVQPAGMVMEDGHWTTKLRASQAFPHLGADYVVSTKQWEPADGYNGQRVRIINNVPTVINLPLVVLDKVYMKNLPSRLKPVFKRTPEELAVDTIGGTVIDTDFSQFEFTQELKVRKFVADTLYSDRVCALSDNINKLDLAGVYIDDFENADGSTATRVYWEVKRYDNPEMAELFAMLTSGTGDTSLLGKALGATEPATCLIKQLGITPAEFWGYPNKDECFASWALRNTGDDCRTLAHVVKEVQKMNDSEFFSWFEKYVTEVKTAGRYDLDVEGEFSGGGKYIGQRAYNKDGVSPVDPKHVVEYCHVDHIGLVANNILKESSIGTHHRPLDTEWISLAGAIEASYRSMVVHGGRHEDYWLHHVSRMLDISGCPASMEEIFKNAETQEFALTAAGGIPWETIELLLKKGPDELSPEEEAILDGKRQEVTLQIMEHFKLKDADEMIWQVTPAEIEEVFGTMALRLIFVLVPDELTRDLTRFINTDTYHRVKKDLELS